MMTSTSAFNNSPGAPPNQSVPLPLHQNGSCVTCRRRKVKCDKANPCSNCTRLGIQCDYPPRKRALRRPRKTLDTDGLSVREVELMKRLNKLEGIVKELSGQADTEGIHNSNDSVPTSTDANVEGITPPQSEAGKVDKHKDESSKSSLDSTAPFEKDKGTLVISEGGTSRYVSHNFWSRLSEQLDDIVQLVFEDHKNDDDDSSPATQDESTLLENENVYQGFVLGYSSSNVNLRALHPLPSQLPFYLQVYTSKVDPLIKLLHIPSLEKIIKEAAENLDSLSKSNEVLLFAIYLSVITSMSVDEVRTNFASDKKFLLDRYCFATEQALARAGFLVSSDLTTLQAFVLYLTIIRGQDESRSRAGWALTRSAIGIAQWLGLHRDGSSFGLQPFECEMRRRIWWQICVLDFRNSEMQGTEPSIVAGTFDTKLPLNINDSDIYPQSATAPEPRVGLTEMTLSLVAFELASTAITLQRARLDKTLMTGFTGSATLGKDAIIQEFCQHMQDTYVKYCTDSSPTASVASNMCQLLIYKMESILLPPLSSESTKELRDQIFIKSIRIVELRCNLHSEKTKQWHWYIRTIVQWHAVAYLLSELCVRDPDENVTWAWNVLDAVFQDWKKVQESAPGVLWQPMRKLIARARRKRELDLEVVREREEEAAKVRVPEYQDVNTGSDALLPAIDPTFGTTGVSQDFQNVPTIEYAGYQGQWLQQPQQYRPTSTPTPWLLEDSALQDLGLDMKGLDTDMQWEGLDDLMQEFHSSVGEGTDAVAGGWGPVW